MPCFARVGELRSSTVIVEDINSLDNEMVALGIKRVLDALRRRDCRILITCYRKHSVATLTRLGLDQDCVVECPYFSEEEVQLLVKMYGGEPEQWGRLPYFSGAHGHPQLNSRVCDGNGDARLASGGDRKDINARSHNR